MKHTALCLLAILLAAPPLAAQTVVEKAESAIRDGMPQAAIAPLQEALRKAPAAEKHSLGLLLARAQLAAGRPADALRTLDSSSDRAAPDVVVLRAAVFAAQGSLEAAAKLAAPLINDQPEAALLLARIRAEQGDREAALALLTASGDGDDNTDPNALRLLLDIQLGAGDHAGAEQTLRRARENKSLPAAELDAALARLRLATDRASEASEIFRRVLATPGLPAPVRDNARLGLARGLLALGIEARAREVLREAINDAPDAPTMRESMAQWIELESRLGGDPAAVLRTWAAEEGHRRAVEAGLRLARLDLDARNTEAAVTVLEQVSSDPDIAPEDLRRARLLLAEARINAGQTAPALELLGEVAAADTGGETTYRLDKLRGRALAAAGQQRQAYEAFAAALRSARTPEETEAAAANALLCALALGNLDLARRSLGELRQAAPTSPELLRWSFLLAAAEARGGEIDALAALARQAPSTEYSFQAKLALAEWRLARGEAPAAERILRTAREQDDASPGPAALAAAEIFAADRAATQSREELVAAGRAFLETHPGTPEAIDVSFKLGELHARGGDHAAAEAVLARLVPELEDADTAILAKFLAAQSAARSMSTEGAGRALQWFDEIAQSNSPLRHRARFEQATLLLRERRFEDALTLYDGLLAGDPPAEVRLAALMEKGDTLVALGAEKPERFTEAATLYGGLATDLSAPADWRDQAACKRAAALARAGQTEAALTAYREVLARPPGTATDFFWFYKAGLEAGRLFEEQQDWPAAIAVYDLLASANGPQSEEIKQRSRRLRLEHFIWEN
jgi:predicted negative regulator of RcsB-dependent stress response